MIEILWHGRGGQGAFTAARLLGAAGSFGDGRYGLAFPSFGPERRGAPMKAFTKIDTKQVGDRSAITQADFVVYLDETLFGPGWEDELKPGGCVLVNSTCAFEDERVRSLDASGMSRRILKREIPNTVFVAALCELIDGLDADDARQAIREYMPAKLHEANIAIVDEVVELLSGNEWGTGANEQGDVGHADNEVSQKIALTHHEAPHRVIPTLRSGELDPAVYAKTTCWDAGHLVSKNAGWRTMCPVVDESACIGCMQCYMLCPDGCVFKAGDKMIGIDYDFCKGCGVCAKACNRGAITMVLEGSVA